MSHPPFGPAARQRPRKFLSVIKHEHQHEHQHKHQHGVAGAMLLGSWRASRGGVLCSSYTVKHVASWNFSNYVAQYGGDQTEEDDGSLTEMMTENDSTQLSRPDEAAYKKDVSLLLWGFEGGAKIFKQFWNLRFEVQKIQPPFSEQAQKDISSRLTALHQFTRFNTSAIREIKIRQVLKELLRWSCTFRHDKRRLRKRSQRLMRRLSGTAHAYQQHST